MSIPENQDDPLESDSMPKRQIAPPEPQYRWQEAHFSPPPNWDPFLDAVLQPPSNYDWTDDDIAAMSLSGCISIFVLTFLWLVFYLNPADWEEFLYGGGGEKAAETLVGMMVASAIALLGSAYVFAIRKHPQRWRSVGLRSTTKLWLIGTMVIGILFMPLNLLLTIASQQLLDTPEINFSGGDSAAPFPIAEFFGVLFMVAVVVPIVEEIFFRGIIYKWLRQRAGLPIGLLISSIAFGGLHATTSLPAISLLGGLCALAYEFSDSLWPAVVIHATNNALAIIIAYVYFSSPLMV